MKRSLVTILAAIVLAPGADACGQAALDNLLSPGRIAYLKGSRLIQVSSHDTTGGNSDFIAMRPGETATLAVLQGPGVITNIWMTVASPDRFFLRRIVLRFFWDGERSPSVEVPLGDFFGTGFQYKHYVTPYLGMSSGGYYCYFPMPFRTSARIEAVNETGREVPSLYFHIAYHQLEQPLEESVASFHAEWRREIRTVRGQPYVVLEGVGEGHVVGVILNVQSYENGLQYLEGDEMVYVDGEEKASLLGTGTEDYFNSGWYFNKGEFAAPYHGLILKDDSLGRTAMYRFHILDVIPFRKSIRFTIEHGHANSEMADYSSTAFWYQREPHVPFLPLPSASLRLPLRTLVPNGAFEAEMLKFREPAPPHRIEEMAAHGPEWSGGRQLLVDCANAGDSFTLLLPAEEERYNLSLYFTRGPSYGDVDIRCNGRAVGKIRGYAEAIDPPGKVELKGLKSVSGLLPLTFSVVGRDVRSAGYAVGLDAVVGEPVRQYIPEWTLIGPFPNPTDAGGQRTGIDIVYPPEQGVDLRDSYTGTKGQTVRWHTVKTPENGQVSLLGFRPPELAVVYAHAYVYSPTDQEVPLLLGSDDGIKVLLNGREIFRLVTIRGLRPDEDRIALALKKGWNSLMLKVENNHGGFGFSARVVDVSHSLLWRTRRGR